MRSPRFDGQVRLEPGQYIWLLLLLAGVFACCTGCPVRGRRANADDVVVQGNSVFTVRVSRYPEKPDFAGAPAGVDIIFESRVIDRDWNEIMVVHSDDMVDFPPANIEFVTREVGVVYFLSKFAVTKDAGKTWSVWDMSESGRVPVRCRIERVHMSPKGVGSMDVDCNETKLALSSSDFGIEWR